MLGPVDFEGKWHLERTIRDNLYGQHGTLVGQAVFSSASPNKLSYDEAGKLSLEAGGELEATRRYHWAFQAEEVVVTFADGSPFHQFTPAGHAAGTDHPCGEDFYQVRYDFMRWPVWTAVWTVHGPRKDYISTSSYQPC